MDEKIYHLCWYGQRISDLRTAVFVIMPSSGASSVLAEAFHSQFLLSLMATGWERGLKVAKIRVLGLSSVKQR